MTVPLCEALARTRTVDPFLTMEVLYQLSYEGAGRSVAALAETARIARWAGDLRLSGGTRIRTWEG
jgi:hypothetical protein